MHVERVDRLLPSEIEKCDFSFEVNCEAVPPFDGNAIQQVVPVVPYRKAYDFDSPDFTDCGAGGDRLLAVAKEADLIRGYILASASWNNYALIEDFAVDSKSRRNGVGHVLMDAAVRWADETGLPGVRVETQSNNVPACRFYQQYGFKLGGFDRHLYDALRPRPPETALYWYLFLAEAGVG